VGYGFSEGSKPLKQRGEVERPFSKLQERKGSLEIGDPIFREEQGFEERNP
jgi:hypothetical protein